MTFRRFRRTDISPLTVMALTGRNQFACLLNRRRAPSQMRDARQIRQPVQDLTNTRLDAHLPAVEIACC